MILTRRGRAFRDITVASLLTIPLAFAASLDAEAMPPPPASTHEVAYEARFPSKPQPWKCGNDWAAKILHKAGFTGKAHAQAWAITWRESKHENLSEGSPWYTGALGIWQIQTSAHAGKPWWSRSAMLDPVKQSRIVHKWSKGGKYWQPWGLTANGTLDATQYGGWSSWHHENWIMAPFRQGLALYPCKTTPPKKQN